jgi:hypothetical protein
VAGAARLVRSGVTVSLSLPLCTSLAPDCPTLADFHMTQSHDADVGPGSIGFAKDYVGVDYHSDGHTHIDALCHIAYGVEIEEGDILLVRTGHSRRLAELGPWDTAANKAGLHPTAMPLLAERGVAALGCDGNSDAAPTTCERSLKTSKL